MKQPRLTGIIDRDGIGITFINNGFDFTFSPVKVLYENEWVSLSSEDGFLYGVTHEHKRVAVYTGLGPQEMKNKISTTFEVSSYVVSSFPSPQEDIRNFKTIVFQGGILNSLTSNRPVESQRNEKHGFVLTPQDQNIDYSFETEEGKCKVSIGIHTSGIWNAKGTSFEKCNTLSLTFDKEQSITSLMRHYKHVQRLIAVMTNTMENPFDDIFIIPGKQTNQHITEFSKVYIRENDVPLVDKDFAGIMFEDINDGVAKLLSIFYNSKRKKPSYSLGFIRKNEDMQWMITEDTIRSICSGLECEISFYEEEMESKQKNALKELCREVRKTIKDFREENDDAKLISEGTYALIDGSIKHWSMSAFEKAKWLYNRFEFSIKEYVGEHRPALTDNEIHDFITFRNDITHGTYREIDNSILRTARIMEVLIYCSLLHRIGVSDEKIAEICKFRLEGIYMF